MEDRSPTPYQQGWYMLSTDFDSALYHANPSDGNEDFVYVIEFDIPLIKNDMWVGYPYLWQGEKINDNSTWFALYKKIPSKFITKIHKVDYDKWINIKNKGF